MLVLEVGVVRVVLLDMMLPLMVMLLHLVVVCEM